MSGNRYMIATIDAVLLFFSYVSFTLCMVVLVMYWFFPGTRRHPNQIIIHHAFADCIFAFCLICSHGLESKGDLLCATTFGRVICFLTQYSLLSSELSYFFLAVDGLVSVSRPFTNPKTRYSYYGISIQAVSLLMAMLMFSTHQTGRHMVGICWVESTKSFFNLTAWEFLFFWIVIIYTVSTVQLVMMAKCLNRLSFGTEDFMRNRAHVLEKMMFYVFTYIIYGICIAVLYGINHLICRNFHSWDPQFISSFVIELFFYFLLASRGTLTAVIFIDNIKDIMTRNVFSRKRDTAWYREVQPLLNSMIRRQILDILSQGVNKAISTSCVEENNQKMFNRATGVYNNVLTEDRYYNDKRTIELSGSLYTDAEIQGDVIEFCEYNEVAFSYLRYLNGITNKEYREELSGLSDCSVSEGASGALFVNSKNQRFIIKFVNKAEFEVLQEILHDLVYYITEKQYPLSDPSESNPDQMLSSEVGQMHLYEDDMRETEAELVSSYQPAFAGDHMLSAITPSDEDHVGQQLAMDDERPVIPMSPVEEEIAVSSEIRDRDSSNPSDFVSYHTMRSDDSRTSRSLQHSPTLFSSPAGSPRDGPEPQLSERYRRRGRQYMASPLTEAVEENTVCLLNNEISYNQPESTGSASTPASTPIVEAPPPLRRDIRSHQSLLMGPHTRQSSLADGESESSMLFDMMLEKVAQSQSQRSCRTHEEREDFQTAESRINSYNVSPNPHPVDSAFLQPHTVTADITPRSAGDISMHPTPTPRQQTSFQSVHEGYDVIKFDNQVVGSFLNKYYGMYSLTLFGQTLYFVVMESIFPRSIVNEVYDLKGSWVNRNPRERRNGEVATCIYCNKTYRYGIDEVCPVSPYSKHDMLLTKKDSNYKARVTVEKTLNQQMSNRLREDVEFLCSHGLMDYSVLIGITNVKVDLKDSSSFVYKSIGGDVVQIPYKSQQVEGPGLFYVGIIDYLQKYTIRKKIERIVKWLRMCGDIEGISDVPPRAYRDRVIERVIGRLFLEFDDVTDNYNSFNPSYYPQVPTQIQNYRFLSADGADSQYYIPTGGYSARVNSTSRANSISKSSVSSLHPSRPEPERSHMHSTSVVVIDGNANSHGDHRSSSSLLADRNTTARDVTFRRAQTAETSSSCNYHTKNQTLYMSESNLQGMDVNGMSGFNSEIVGQHTPASHGTPVSRHSLVPQSRSDSGHERHISNLSTYQESTSDVDNSLTMETINEVGSLHDHYTETSFI